MNETKSIIQDILYWNIASMQFRYDWTHCVDRDKAKYLLGRIEERINEATQIIILDYVMVELMDDSFCDSFLIPLLKNSIIPVIGVNIKVDVFESVDESLKKASLIFLAIDDNMNPYLFGAKDDNANDVFKILLKHSLTRPEIYRQLDRKREVMDNTIEYLIKNNFLKISETSEEKWEFLEVKNFEKISPYIGMTLPRLIKDRYNLMIEKGHFILPSGVHVKKLYHVSKIMEYPRLIKHIAIHFADIFIKLKNISYILTVETPSNIILAHRLAQAIGGDVKSIYAKLSEKEEGNLVLRDGFKIEKGSYGLIVIDVVVTGFIVNKLIKLARMKGSRIRGICSIFNLRAGMTAFPLYTFESLIQEDEDVYSFDDCPSCKKGIQPTKPNIMPGDWK